MAEMITWRGNVIGLFLSHAHSPEKTRFLTADAEPLQCGIGIFKQGSRVEPHCHVSEPVLISEFPEFIMIRRGKAKASVYDPEGVLLRTLEMVPGDSLLLLRGGHAFEFLEDTELLEIKQGPYLGRDKMKHPLPVPADNLDLVLPAAPKKSHRIPPDSHAT